MKEELDLIFEDAKERMESSINHFEKSLSKIRAGKASPVMLSGITLEYYGTTTALDKVSNVMCPDSRTITVQPWEKKLLPDLERAIINSNLGFTPTNNGEILIISLPALTQDRRKELVKLSKTELETAKVNIRNIRKDANNSVRKTEGASEDMMKQYEEMIQNLTDKFIAKAEAINVEKEKDIMSIG